MANRIRIKKALECEDCNATIEVSGGGTLLVKMPLAYMETAIEGIDHTINSELLTRYARHREVEHSKRE